MIKNIICTVCPRGCSISVKGENSIVESVENYGCKRGIEYAKAEFVCPVRILTTVVKVDGKDELIPVRSNKPIPKSKILECMEEIRKTTITLPVKMHQVIIENVCDTGVSIVATKEF
ncbi:MAG: DUF1667 domain-containing protein [Clostridia bacterium]|nr:DUF1667 domain-containing protein [Clostridia bacterium]